MNRLAIFDCDGTLVDSQHNICAAMGACFDEAGLAAPGRRQVLDLIGLSLVDIMRTLLPDADDAMHERMAASYRLTFQGMRGRGGLADEPLYEGILEAIAALEDAGWLLGVATGKSDRGLGLILAHHGLAGRFVTLQTADRHPSKPHPAMIAAAMAEAGASPETTVMIGDTSYDMAMAVAAGAHPLGVAWGYHPPELLHDGGAAQVLAHPREIAAAMEQRL
ncbi:HAD family hydrolase [Sphingomonas gilva]|uniref:HAD family hydrolase n=1 Tax=Sphingomonas gilva TaxID=2305907 RepID=A0A396RQW9_9SPHN|nr:HAD-IA family hydrolase [Sphingomonas gilva]RHW19037.1 HAD family hydrolase [Sphingomonas gilva]